jgi:uncharacterized protein YndB with AHSA1/START domain
LRRLYAPVVVEDDVAASREQVWEVLADPDTYPAWLVGATDIRAVDDAFPAAGAEFHHTVGLGGPLTVDDRTESAGAQSERRLALLVHAGPLHGRVEFELQPAPRGTHVRFSEKPVGPLAVLTPLLRFWLYARNRRSLGRLRDLLASRVGRD